MRRHGNIIALETPALCARDALMSRAVEQQISAFAAVQDHTQKAYLHAQWSLFLEQARKRQSTPVELREGDLTAFLSHLQRSESQAVWVPKRSFRSLSPNNPYARAAGPAGSFEEVRPTAIALRLMSCREQLAVDWLELVPTLAQLSKARERDTPVTQASADASSDKQLLLGLATKIATRDMLAELSLRPSTKHLHDWLQSFVLRVHATDLTTRGSVEALHASLATQPMCIRGGALVDPLAISLELFERCAFILEVIEDDLHAAPAHVVPLTSGFLETCLLL